MPTVPVYDRQLVERAPLPGPRMPMNQGTNLFGEIGASLRGISAELERRRQQEQNDADTFRAESQINKLHDALADLSHGNDGALNLKGENVFKLGEPLTSAYQKRYDEAAKSMESELSNDNQKRKFGLVSGRLRSQFTTQLGRHEANETKTFRESTFKGVISSELDAAGRALESPDPQAAADQIKLSVDRISGNARLFYGRELGLGKEQIDAEVLKLESSVHKRIVDRYLEANNPGAAKTYYEANKDRITVEDGAKARQQIEKDGRDYLVNQEADRIWSTMGPKGDNDAVNLDLMDKAASKAFEKDADGRKLLISELRQRSQAHDYSAKERQNAVVGGIWKQVLDGKRLADIRRSPEFRGLDGKNQAVMIGQIEDFQKPKADPNASLQKFAEYWAVVSDPARLATMSDAEIFAKAPVMGTELVKQALMAKQKLANQETKVIEAKIDQDSFNYFARNAGIDPKQKKNAASLGDLKFRVENIIDAEQRKSGNKQLTRDEKDAILKKLLVEVPVTVKQPWYLPGATTTEPRRVFDVQHPENIAIPPADRAVVIDALKKGGITNPTDAQIRDGFIRLKMK